MNSGNSSTILNLLYRGTTTLENFSWDAMGTVPIFSLIMPEEVEQIRQLITSPRYSGNNKLKMEKIDGLMHYRGFVRFAGGTNRLVYIHSAAPNAVFKVAIDSVGIKDNPAEFVNQHFLKPYCCKVFECSPCGTIASFEKVDRITNWDEFYSIAEDYFYILSRVILGKYIMEDIGINYFMNVGIRRGCHPVILDFPYLFELDGGKLECMTKLDDGTTCHGEIDYDDGFNKLVCKKCGRTYRARDLAKPPEGGGMLFMRKGGSRMTINYTKDGVTVKKVDTTVERDHLNKNDKETRKSTGLVVSFSKDGQNVQPTIPTAEKKTPVTKASKPSDGFSVKITGQGAPRVENKAPETTPSVRAHNVAPEDVVAKSDDQKAPVLERVVNVSFGKSTVKHTDKIITDSDDSELKVTFTKKPVEEKTKKPVEETPEKEETVVTHHHLAEEQDLVPEDKRHLYEASNDEEEPASMEAPKQMIQAVTFGDEEPEEEPVVEEVPEKKNPHSRMFFCNEPPTEETAEEGVFYCVRTCEACEATKIIECNVDDPKDIDETLYDIYQLIDGVIHIVCYDFSEDKWIILDDEVAHFDEINSSDEEAADAEPDAEPETPADEEASDYEESEEEPVEEETESAQAEEDASNPEAKTWVLYYTNVLPAPDNTDEEAIYCIPNNPSVHLDDDKITRTFDLSSVDLTGFDLYTMIDFALRRVHVEDGYLYEGAPEGEEEEDTEEDELVASLQASMKRKSLDDLV